MSVLCILAESANTVVSKDQLLEEAWGGRNVSEEVLTNAISALRKNFKDRAKTPKFIETIPRKGYRLLISPQPIEAKERQTPFTFSVLSRVQSLAILGFAIFVILLVLVVNNKDLVRLYSESTTNSPKSKNVWVYQTGGDIQESGFESGGNYYFYSEDGFVYSIDQSNGSENWRYRIGRNNIRQMLLVNNLVITLSEKGLIYALNKKSGSEIWRKSFSGAGYYSQLSLGADNELLSIADNVLSIINSRTGESANEFEFDWDITFINKVSDSTILIGYEENNLIYYSLSDRKEIWRKKLEDELWNLPVFDEHSIVLPFRNNLMVVDKDDGKIIWQTKIINWSYPAKIAPGKVINMTGEGKVTAFDISNGNQLWMKQLSSAPKTSTVFENNLLVSTDDKSILLFDVDNGNLMNHMNTPTIVSNMTVTDGTNIDCTTIPVERAISPECLARQYSLMIGSSDGSLHKANLNFQDGNVEIVSSQELNNPPLSNNSEQVVFQSFRDNITPSLYWRIPTFGVPGTATFSGNIIYYSDDRYLYKSSLVTKKSFWKKALHDAIGTRIVVVDDHLLYGSRDGKLYLVESDTGENIWSFSIQSPIISTPFVNAGMVYFGSQNDYFYALTLKDGALKWRYKTGEDVNGGSAYDSQSVYFGSGDSHIYSLDLENGDLNWRYDIGEWSVDALIVDENTVYAGNHDGKLVALDTRDGSLNWQFKTEGYIWFQKSIDKENIYVGSNDHFVYAIDRQTGAEKWRFETGAAANYSNLLIDGVLHFASEDGNLYAVQANTREKHWVMKTSNKLHNVSGNSQWLAVPSTKFELLVIKLPNK